MELAEGHNLESEFRRRHPGAGDLKALTMQILKALMYIHSKGVVHRDVKPSNVVITTRFPIRVKLVDFGVASDTTDLRSYCGTKQYIAPEVSGNNKYNAKADIWSTGIMFLQLSHGLPSYGTGTSPSRWLSSSKSYLASQEQTLPIKFVATLLTVRPKSRPSAEQCLHHAYFRHCSLKPRDRDSPIFHVASECAQESRQSISGTTTCMLTSLPPPSIRELDDDIPDTAQCNSPIAQPMTEVGFDPNNCTTRPPVPPKKRTYSRSCSKESQNGEVTIETGFRPPANPS